VKKFFLNNSQGKVEEEVMRGYNDIKRECNKPYNNTIIGS
jgi:hypothetical protein